ncbi:GntR family transcriptional regulator [uncultured Corynebacterium sp.]|uniref:GntR family transcriptional regulator n=1 Tax=uncultured Corynebacterium sp. TaxID=159447 RepID=UPI0025CBE8AB|nr:GntR family transcriptional regulator [uncultured Corynebacterium sp.]
MGTRYEQIARELREDIRSERFAIGAPLPSEKELSERFHVAPGTMRQALNVLVDEGTLSSKRGARKVVLRMPARFPEISKFRSFAQWAYGRGRTPGGHVIHQEWVVQTEQDARLLRLAEGEKVLKVLRVRTIDGSPIMLERTRYPAWVGAKVEPMDPSCPSVTNELASRHNVHFFAADNVFSAAKAGEVDAKWLPLDAGDPVLVHRRLSRDAKGTPLEMSEDRYIADALSIAVPTSGKNNVLSWTTLNRFPWG